MALPDVSVADLLALPLPAIEVAIVGYTDNVLTARAFAGRTRSTVDATRGVEPSLGTANVAAGLLQTLPVSSSGSRTAIAAALGGRSLLYSIVALVVLGSRGHSGVAETLLGSVSGHVLRHAACPVEIVREQVSPS